MRSHSPRKGQRPRSSRLLFVVEGAYYRLLCLFFFAAWRGVAFPFATGLATGGKRGPGSRCAGPTPRKRLAPPARANQKTTALQPSCLQSCSYTALFSAASTSHLGTGPFRACQSPSCGLAVSTSGLEINPLGHGNFLSGLKLSGNAMAASVWRGPRPFVRWAAMCANGLLWHAGMADGR
jgi:hypothetical protein